MLPKRVKKILSLIVALTVLWTSVNTGHAAELALGNLPVPGTMVALSQSFNPPSLKGIKVYPDNPFRFDFILDPGDGQREAQALKDESGKLIRYFLASLTIPEKDLWVNLSPYEQDRIITNEFGQTEMGRDLLEQDYLLKQITASVLYPDGGVGKKFWAKVYQAAFEKFGTTDIPVDTFNKVWITPDKAEVFENEDKSFVVQSHLKVSLESDYLAQEKNLARGEVKSGSGAASDLPGSNTGGQGDSMSATQAISKQILREIVLPELEKEVNEGKNFAPVRQIYQSLILAAWFKKKVKESLLSKVYVDRKKVVGVNIDDPDMSQRIWEQYVEAFKKGAYNYIKEEEDPYSQEILPRKYFSGGLDYSMLSEISMTITHERARLARVIGAGLIMLAVGLASGTVPAANAAALTANNGAIVQPAQREWQDITPDLLYRNATMMGRVSEDQLRESIAISSSKKNLTQDVHRFLVESGVLPKEATPVRVLFLKGLSSPESLGDRHASFALAISEKGHEVMVVSADGLTGLNDREAFNFLAVKIAHEGTHIFDFRDNPHPTGAEKMASEARAYENTILVMEKLVQDGRASYPQDQLDAQRAVARAFSLWMGQEGKIKGFRNYYYDNVSILSLRTPPVVLIDLVDEATGQRARAKIQTDNGTVKFQRLIFTREPSRVDRHGDNAHAVAPDLSKKWPLLAADRAQALDRAQRSLMRSFAGILLVASLTFGVGCESITSPTEPPVVNVNLPSGWNDLSPEFLYSHASIMGKITPEQLNRSIEISMARQPLAGDVQKYLLGNDLLASDTPQLRVLFLAGLSQPGSLGDKHAAFALAISERNLIVVSADAFEGLSDQEATALLAIKVAHEGTHVRNFYQAPGMSALEDEALAYEATSDAMDLLQSQGMADYSPEQLQAQLNVSEAFQLLIDNRAGLDNFDRYYYESIELAEDGNIVRIYLFNLDNNSDKLRAEVNIAAGSVQFQRQLVGPATTADVDRAQRTLDGVMLSESATAEDMNSIVDGIQGVDREARFRNNPTFGRNHRLQRDTIEGYLKDSEVKVLWAQKDGQIIGFAILTRINSAEPYLSRIASLPEAPDGLGTLLMDRLISDLRSDGKKSMAFIPFSRTKSLDFFRKYAARQNGQVTLKSTSSIAWQFDFAQNRAINGGIDFNSDRLDLEVENSGGGVRFNIDPAMLRRFEAIPGFSPVVLEMKPLGSVQSFLGIQSN